MTALDNLERVAAPLEQQLREYVKAGSPLILTGLFADQEIRRIQSFEAALEALGEVVLAIRPEYSYGGFEAHRNPEIGATAAMTFRDYTAHYRSHPDTPMMCLEQETPAEILAHTGGFPYPNFNHTDGDRLRSFFFVGHAGSASNLHYDRDYHATLLYQVAGRKRVVCISPRHSQKLRPMMNFSEYLLSKFQQSDRLAFLRYTDAREGILYPGETLLIPVACWHHVEYLDEAISVNFKLPRNRYLALLGGGLFHSNYRVQAVAAKLADGRNVQSECGDLFDQLLQLYTAQPREPADKFAAIDQLFAQWYARICPDHPQQEYFSSLSGTREADLWRDQLTAGRLYPRTGAGTQASSLSP